MKFKLDENMPAELASLLREAGHDAADAAEEGLSGKADPRVLATAASEGQILLTCDLDFADVRHYPPGTHAGIVVFRLHDQRWQTLQGPVTRLVAGGDLKVLKRGLAIVDGTRVRYKRSRRKDGS